MRMSKMRLSFVLILLSLNVFAGVSELKMIDANTGERVYSDTCANGANNDKETFNEFVKRMLENPNSKLALYKQKLLKEIEDSGEEPRGEGVYIEQWAATFHDRMGCGENRNSFSAFIVTVTGGNSNYTLTRALVTIDDDDDSGVRTLKLRDIQPIKLRTDEE